MSVVRIEYGDEAIGAKDDFKVAVNNETDFSDASQIATNSNTLKYSNASENYTVALDGVAVPLPSDTQGKMMGWWSDRLSDSNGVFYAPLEMSLISAQNKYTSIGFTFVFDTISDIYPTHLSIVWYRDGTMLDKKDFYPNSSTYFCENKVEYFDEAVITFYSINMPNTRMKLYALVYGYLATFDGSELNGVRISQNINPISNEIAINTTDFIVNDKKGINYSFQSRQNIKTFFNNKLIGVSFVKSAKRMSKTVWNIQSEDYIGIMDSVPFVGGIYNNKDATELLREIFETAKVPYIIENLDGVTVSGHIPYGTCREALMQVAFATQMVVDTSYVEGVHVFALSEAVSQTITLDRIFQGQNITEGTRVTEVNIAAHAYYPVTDKQIAYEATTSGIGNEILVIFPEPLHDLEITGGTIIEGKYGANYAVINAGVGCVLTGQKYDHLQTIKIKKNPFVTATDKDNVKSITNATLISAENVDNVLEKCYNWLTRTNRMSAKIVEGYHRNSDGNVARDAEVMLGDNVDVETAYAGTFNGRAIKSQFNLNGAILVKDVEII
jgi:hypothetical protein